jgi:hypothetical protein
MRIQVKYFIQNSKTNSTWKEVGFGWIDVVQGV